MIQLAWALAQNSQNSSRLLSCALSWRPPCAWSWLPTGLNRRNSFAWREFLRREHICASGPRTICRRISTWALCVSQFPRFGLLSSFRLVSCTHSTAGQSSRPCSLRCTNPGFSCFCPKLASWRVRRKMSLRCCPGRWYRGWRVFGRLGRRSTGAGDELGERGGSEWWESARRLLAATRCCKVLRLVSCFRFAFKECLVVPKFVSR